MNEITKTISSDISSSYFSSITWIRRDNSKDSVPVCTCVSYSSLFAVPLEEIEETIFKYQEDIVELLPNPPSYKNPYYRVADVYEPCDDSVTFSNGQGIVNITRGHGQGMKLSELGAADVTVSCFVRMENVSIYIYLHCRYGYLLVIINYTYYYIQNKNNKYFPQSK